MAPRCQGNIASANSRPGMVEIISRVPIGSQRD
jgi:hypothetical protein